MDTQLKYLEIRNHFHGQATEIEIAIRQNHKVLEKLADYLSKNKGSNTIESERNEFLRDFVVKVASTNESVLNSLKTWRDTFEQIGNDLELVRASKLAGTLQEQSEMITLLQNQRDNFIKQYGNEVRERNKKNT